MKPFFVALIACSVAACAGLARNDPPDAEGVFADRLFKPLADPISTAGLFALSEPMKAFAAGPLSSRRSVRGTRRGLFEGLREELRVDYDSATTRNAAETFAARSGNCMSLVILAAAFAKEFGVPFSYQEAYAEGAWSRADGFAFYSGHINLMLGVAPTGSLPLRTFGEPMTIDFLEPEGSARVLTHAIPEEKVIAMYLNNRAVEALVEGDLDAAYWWARAALQALPSFTSGYNTLAVTYRRHGDQAEAERALRAGLEREPTHPHLLSNLALVLEAQGRTAQAAEVRAQLAQIAPYPPFYFLDRGLAAAAQGDYAAAVELYDRELRRMPYDDELLFAIGVAQLHLGKVGQARKHVAQALEYATVGNRRDIYAAKLSYLRSLEN